MSSLDKLFSNSLKNDITHSFVESVEAIMFLEGISSEDFLRLNKVSVYTPIIKDNWGISQKKLSFTDQYENVNTHYDILSVWLYKLGENLRRIYSATKKGNDTSSLIEQQNNLYIISNYFMDYWDTKNESAFFPRSIFGRHDELEPLDYLIYLGTHDCLSKSNLDNHLKLLQKLSHKIDSYDIPDFLPKLALSSTNSKLLKTVLPYLSTQSLISNLKYQKSSDGFKILSFEYILENMDKFKLENFEKIDLVRNFIGHDVLFSKHFDEFILDKSVYLDKISQMITPEMSKELEIILTHKSSKNKNYLPYQSYFLKGQKKTNPISLVKDLEKMSFEEIDSSYQLSPSLVSDSINHMVYQASLKDKLNKEQLKNNFKNLVDKLHTVLNKEHLATIISLDSDFISFCKPVYLHIRLMEKLEDSPPVDNAVTTRRNKI